MNKVALIGRPTADAEVRYTQNKAGENMAIARLTLAVNRKGKDAGTDFINIVAFGKQGEFAEKFIQKGRLYGVEGRIQTGSYTNKDGKKVYTFEVVAEGFDFCDSKNEPAKAPEAPEAPASDGFMDIPEGIEQDLPFK